MCWWKLAGPETQHQAAASNAAIRLPAFAPWAPPLMRADSLIGVFGENAVGGIAEGRLPLIGVSC